MEDIFRRRLNIIVDKNLVVQLGTRDEQRMWKERLFSWPWKPWQSTKQVPRYVPDANVYVLEGGKSVVMHPAMLNHPGIQEGIEKGHLRR